VVSIRQLQRLLGYSRAGVKHLVEAGRLHRIHPGVYAIGHTNLSLHGECLGAVLAVGPGALLSYHSAGWLWGLVQMSPKPIHVTAFVPRHHPAPHGAIRHRARNLVDRTGRSSTGSRSPRSPGRCSILPGSCGPISCDVPWPTQKIWDCSTLTRSQW
jgi:hypothetical protein